MEILKVMSSYKQCIHGQSFYGRSTVYVLKRKTVAASCPDRRLSLDVFQKMVSSMGGTVELTDDEELLLF